MSIQKLLKQYIDVIMYLFFGVLTTVINVISYWILAYPLKLGIMISTVIAWFVAVLFAYITNRKWVFHSSSEGFGKIIKEVISFFTCRIVTGCVDWVCMWVFVDLIQLNDVIIKFMANIIVIVLNYITSKLVIFRQTRKV